MGQRNGVKVRGHVLVWHAQVNPSIFAKDFKAYSGGNLTVSDTDVLDEDCLVSREVLLERLKLIYMEYWSTLIGMGMLILFMHGMW